jgi:hypothetical protein
VSSKVTVRLKPDTTQMRLMMWVYSGTTTGEEFTARQRDPLEGLPAGFDCSGTRIIQLPGVSNLSGRFASDGQTMSGTELNVYPLNTGETGTYQWNWQATRRNFRAQHVLK